MKLFIIKYSLLCTNNHKKIKIKFVFYKSLKIIIYKMFIYIHKIIQYPRQSRRRVGWVAVPSAKIVQSIGGFNLLGSLGGSDFDARCCFLVR